MRVDLGPAQAAKGKFTRCPAHGGQGLSRHGTHPGIPRLLPGMWKEAKSESCFSRRRRTMPKLADTKTHENLKHAFAGESQANRRYLYFARRADIEGFPDVGGLFRDTSEAETGHAFGHLDFLKEVGDPVTGVPIGETSLNLKSAIESETYEFTEMYPGFARTA